MENAIKLLVLATLVFAIIAAFTGCNGIGSNFGPHEHECNHSGGVASCTEWGKCSECGEKYIAPTGHNEVTDKAVAATCTTTGLTEGKHCSVCKMIIVAQEPINALGHTEVIDKAVAATCTETGLTEGKHCSACGEILVSQQPVEAIGHSFPVFDANNISGDWELTTNTSGQCECELDSTYIAMCKNGCGEITFKTTAAHGHVWSEWRNVATSGNPCTSIPVRIRECTVCQHAECIEQEIGTATGHTEVIDAAVAATCTETGLTEGKHCSVCNETFVAQSVVPALGHSYDNDSDANCNSCGEKRSIGLEYRLLDDGTYYVMSIGTCKDTIITIPQTYNEKAVTSIGNNAFSTRTTITSITIPNSVTTIGENAFHNCTSLRTIKIPDSVISIGEYAFNGCTALTSIIIPQSMTSISNYTFRDCTSLKTINIPDSVTSIGDFAFAFCRKLESLTIPDSVTSIGDSAFYCCTNLISIVIPESITNIVNYAFSKCTSLKTIEIPDSVTSIGNGALEGCESLTSIIFEGTIAEWNAISKGSKWNYDVPATKVVCSDGIASPN